MKKDYGPNRKNRPFIDNLDEEKIATIPDLKQLAKKAISRIQRDRTWAGHLFSTDKGRIHGVLLYKKPLSTIFEESLSSGASDSYCEEFDEVIHPPENH